MLTLEIDGQNVEVQDGSTIMDAAQKMGVYVPHFCYHKKLSIAANCRMCLVEVEKAPKPLPACATPATQGMKVKTASSMAKMAQKGVMELLLINHPLDCPICDQGGECQLQDLAVGYGEASSRYEEPKRVVFNKNLGPLIATDMTRCIHCTRCVRFGQEVAGVMELGMANRGEHSEILSFVGQGVDSELSGNMIDLCPVGALTSKPFRYSARTWELARRHSISPHDGLGSHLIVQTKHNQVMRVVPFEKESINECWLSDRDRFSYEGLNSSERLAAPMIKKDGEWHEVSWAEAVDHALILLRQVNSADEADQVGMLASPSSTCEELYVLKNLASKLNTANIDTRLRRSDFSLDHAQQGGFWLGRAVADLNNLKAGWIIGSNLRADHPLLAQRLRKASKQGAKFAALMPFSPDWLMPLASTWVCGFEELSHRLDALIASLSVDEGLFALSESERSQLDFLMSQSPVIFIGQLLLHHPQFGSIYPKLHTIAERLGLSISFLGEAGANAVGAHWVGASPTGVRPSYTGLNAQAMFQSRLRAYILMGFDPDLDVYNPALAMQALKSANAVIALSSYKTSSLLDVAQVLLPIAPFSETSGSFVNIEGVLQSFNAVAQPYKSTLPAWRVLMALLQGLSDDESNIHTSFENLHADMSGALQDIKATLNNGIQADKLSYAQSKEITGGWYRLGDILPYSVDPILRRATALQKRELKQRARVGLHPLDIQQLGVEVGASVKLRQSGAVSVVTVYSDTSLSRRSVRVPHTTVLGGLMDPIEIEKG